MLTPANITCNIFMHEGNLKGQLLSYPVWFWQIFSIFFPGHGWSRRTRYWNINLERLAGPHPNFSSSQPGQVDLRRSCKKSRNNTDLKPSNRKLKMRIYWCERIKIRKKQQQLIKRADAQGLIKYTSQKILYQRQYQGFKIGDRLQLVSYPWVALLWLDSMRRSDLTPHHRW